MRNNNDGVIPTAGRNLRITFFRFSPTVMIP
jgi:hypothetical protein